jgi:DNA polymerase III subunit alpha
MPDYIHLHNHSHYSLLDAACTIDDLVEAAAEAQMPAVALTDHGVMFGAVEFYKKAKSRGIKPIIGNEMYVVTRGSRFDKAVSDTHPDGKRHGYNHLVLLAKNEIGYHNLIKLTTLGHTEGFYYKPRIDFDLLRAHHEGIIALTACAGGVVAAYLANGDYQTAKKVASELKDIFADDVYLEIQDHGLDREAVVREGMALLSRELGIKRICTNDCHYIDRRHAVAHNVFLHIADVREAEDVFRLRYGTDQVYFKSEREMLNLFRDAPDAIECTMEVMEKCNLDLRLGTNHMPDFPIPADVGVDTLDAYMLQLARQGLARRYPQMNAEIEDRLKYESDVITRMGYAGYFLIVQDFINAARTRGIRVGPGRGSAAGSLIAYGLGITDVDPIRYDLLFERFLNPDRVSMPDIDVDFQDDRRDEVIAYVREKYGAESVSQIITFNRLYGRAVIRDVGRVLGLPISTLDSITRLIPVKMGKVAPLKYAFGLDTDATGRWQAVKELDWLQSSDEPKIKQLIEYSVILEGLNRGAGMHAAGVVIAPRDTSDFVPLYKTPTTGLMTQYNMSDLEEAGLLKMDFLGLITLTVIDHAIENIRQTRDVHIDIDAIPLDDEKTYTMIGEGHTIGVFQFESAGMREYLFKLKPKSIDDLAAMNALYRPGPMEFIDDFIDRKFGRKQIEYLHPIMEPILKSTYGVIVFQEQVMQLASTIAGFTLAQADIMRRAMGKKKADVMAQQRESFVAGAVQHGISPRTASEIFDLIDKFANYGFNKSHSVAYSLLAYQTAWLKANFTPEFMAALMTAQMTDTDQLVLLTDECRKLGIDILPPDVNNSGTHFGVTDGRIRFGLAGIKNVGTGAVESIVEARQGFGTFQTIFDFTERVSSRAVNKKTLESLVLAGAMDTLQGNRRQLFEVIESAINYGVTRQQERDAGQSSLFDDVSQHHAFAAQPILPGVLDWPEEKKLADEKSVLGYYISGHPLESWRLECETLSTVHLTRPDPSLHGTIVRACGLLSAMRTKIDKRGRTMAFLTLEDFSGKAECLVFADAYEKSASSIHADNKVLVTGKAEINADSLRIIAEEVLTLDDAIRSMAKGIVVSVSTQTATKKQIDDGIRILDQHRDTGSASCYFRVSDGGSQNWNLITREIRIRPSREALTALRSVFGFQNVRILLET